MAKFLIQHDPHINAVNNLGSTPLDAARLNEKTQMVDLLISKGTKIGAHLHLDF